MHNIKGYLMVITAAALWGLSGTAAQNLFQDAGVEIDWLVTVRLIVSGIIFLVMALLGKKRQMVFDVLKNKYSIFQFAIFGVIGMLGVQYTYFAAIDEGNAAVATLLQYIAPIFILAYFLIFLRKIPSLFEIFAVFLTLLGTFLLLTNGSAENLTVSGMAVTWGIISAFSLAFYTLYSEKLVKQFDSIIVVGWGMLIGGVAISFLQSPFSVTISSWGIKEYLLIIFVILFGTVIPFYLFIDSLRFVNSKITSLLSCTEPLSAVLASVLWLGVPFGIWQAAGTLCIIAMVFLLTLKPKKSAADAVKKEADIAT
nr:DMT family transporter [Bacillus sp. M6-12]